jgi:hypothetical protein
MLLLSLGGLAFNTMKMRAGKNSSADAGPPTDCCSNRKIFLQHRTTQFNLSCGALAESIPNISEKIFINLTHILFKLR